METVSGIGFDLDHTLVIDNRLERVAFLRLLEVILNEGGRTVGTLGDEIASIDGLLAEQRHGEFSIDDGVRRFVAERQAQPAERHVDWFRRTALEMVDEFVVPLPGVKETLEGLRERGIALGLLTNGWSPLQERKAERAGFQGPILVSSEIGVRKPAPRAFEILLLNLGTDPGASWYVGDDPRDDVDGAQEADMSSVWIDWERKQYPLEVAPPQHTIHQFCELLQLFSEPIRGR